MAIKYVDGIGGKGNRCDTLSFRQIIFVRRSPPNECNGNGNISWHELHLATGRRHRVQLSFYEINSFDVGRDATWPIGPIGIAPAIPFYWSEQLLRFRLYIHFMTAAKWQRDLLFHHSSNWAHAHSMALLWLWHTTVLCKWVQANECHSFGFGEMLTMFHQFSIRQWNGIEKFSSKNFLRFWNSQSQRIRLDLLH